MKLLKTCSHIYTLLKSGVDKCGNTESRLVGLGGYKDVKHGVRIDKCANIESRSVVGVTEM